MSVLLQLNSALGPCNGSGCALCPPVLFGSVPPCPTPHTFHTTPNGSGLGHWPGRQPALSDSICHFPVVSLSFLLYGGMHVCVCLRSLMQMAGFYSDSSEVKSSGVGWGAAPLLPVSFSGRTKASWSPESPKNVTS